MARYSFLPLHKGKHFCFDQRGLASNYEAARLLGKIISNWSRVEHQQAMILAAMLGENPDAGVALFSSIRNSNIQQDAIKAVADRKIDDPEMRMVIDAAWNVVAVTGKQRDDLAHGILGWSFDLPGLTLWVKSSEIACYEASAWIRLKESENFASNTFHGDLKNNIFVYSNEDLDDILKGTDITVSILFNLYGVIRHDKSRLSPEYRFLVGQSDIEAEMHRLIILKNKGKRVSRG